MPTAALRLRAFLLCCAMSLAGCKHDQAACGASKPCGLGMRCNLSTLRCEAPPADMSMCAAGTCDMALPADLGLPAADMGLPAPDLEPPCRVATDCTSAATPICGSDGKCRACADSSDDAQCAAHGNGKNVCKMGGGPCVGCNDNSACSGTTPICDQFACRGCASDSECPNKVCEVTTGVCVDGSMIALVDHGGLGVSACNSARSGAGAQTGVDAAHAWCDIQPAIAAPSARPYLLVAGYGYSNTMKYGPINITRDVTVVGPLGADSVRAVVGGDSTHAGVTVGSVHTVVIDGMDINTGGFSLQGIYCSQAGATVTVRNAILNLNGEAGLESHGCVVSVDSTSIDDNGGGILVTNGSLTLTNSEIGANSVGGLSITGATYTVVNNFITGTQGNTAAVNFGGNVSGLFWFNTVAHNFMGTAASGIDCTVVTGANPRIQASVIWGNAKNASGNSVAGNCDFVYDDIDDTTTPTGGNNVGNFNANPNFKDPNNGNFQIQAPSGCTDKITAATGLTGGTLPTRDYYGHARPRAATGGYDVGCQQLVP
jgi:hypothetical protein